MKINLTEAEKIALANHLAERSTKTLITELEIGGMKIPKKQTESIRKDKYEFFKKCLDETNDY